MSLKSADAKTIYSTLVEILKEKNIQISKFLGMGFDGAATFSEPPEEEFTSCSVRALPFSPTSTCLCSSSQLHQWD